MRGGLIALLVGLSVFCLGVPASALAAETTLPTKAQKDVESNVTLESEWCRAVAPANYTSEAEHVMAIIQATTAARCIEEVFGQPTSVQQSQITPEKETAEETRRTRESSEVVAVRENELKTDVVAVQTEVKAVKSLLEGTLKVSCTGCGGGTGGKVEFGTKAREEIRAGGQGGAVLLLGGFVAFMFSAAIWSVVRQRGS